MDSEYPLLEVRKQGFEEYILRLEDIIKPRNNNRVTIGRSSENDIVFPDPAKKISRQHCALEGAAGCWWVVDSSSSNGTFVQKNGSGTEIDVRKNGRIRLADGNVILILSLFRITDWEREEINLRPLERALIYYMAKRNQANNQQPVVCSYKELTEAAWGDPFGHNNNEVTRLIWGIRNKVESDSGESKFLQTVQGRGYLLDVKLLQ